MSNDWPRPVVHWEIVARDPESQAAFYSQLFNWEIGTGDFRIVSPGLGGPEPGPGGHVRKGDKPAVSLYVQVRDLAASLALATQLGGSVVAQPFDLPGGPTIAAIADPEGNTVGLVQQ
jgi:predicted enzyme related to lactoylglutathione lyase